MERQETGSYCGGTEFEFQYYYRRWLGAMSCLAISLNFLLEPLHPKTEVYCILCVVVMFVLMTVYYAVLENWNIFIGKGCYWSENNILYIRTGGKIHEITNVRELRGDVKTVFHSRYALILIETDKTEIKLFSVPVKQGQGFEESSHYPLYSLILDR